MLLDYIAIIIYGIIQGFAEVLPISSSGHLALANTFIPLPQVNLAITAVLHAGSLVAIAWWFHYDLRLVWNRFRASIRMIQNRYRRRGQDTTPLTAYQKMPYYMGLSLVPTAIIGLLLQDVAENVFANKLWTPVFLFLNGLILVITAWRSRSERTMDELDWKDYILIGTMQGVAVIPGISRLGLTLCTSLWRGLGWYDSLRLSFLLSIPAIIGGLIIQMPQVITTSFNGFSIPQLLLGTTLTSVLGLIGIRLLSNTLLEKKTLFSMGSYCCMLGAFAFLNLALGL